MSFEGRVIIAPGKKTEKISAKSKRFITKVIFLAAAAHPLYDSTIRSYIDGKIVICPSVEKTAAKRISFNRSKGTPVTSLNNINRNVNCNCITKKLILEIRDRLPSGRRRIVQV